MCVCIREQYKTAVFIEPKWSNIGNSLGSYGSAHTKKCLKQCLTLGEPRANLALPFTFLEKVHIFSLNNFIYLPMGTINLSYEIQ